MRSFRGLWLPMKDMKKDKEKNKRQEPVRQQPKAEDRSHERLKATYLSLSALLVVGCLLLVFRWVSIDIDRSFVKGLPATRNYFALFNMRYKDEKETEQLRDFAKNSIVDVLVRKTGHIKEAQERLSLIGEGRLEEAGVPQAFIELIRALPVERRDLLLRVTSKAGLEVSESDIYRDSMQGVSEDYLWRVLENSGLDPGEANISVQVLSGILVPAVSGESGITDRLRDIVADAVDTVPKEIQAGEVIVSKGDTITPQIAELLRRQGYPEAAFPIKTLLIISLSVISVFIWAKKNVLTLWDERKAGFLAFLFALCLVMGVLSAFYGMTGLGIVPMAGIAYVTMPHRRARATVLAGTFLLASLFFDVTPISSGEILLIGAVVAGIGEILFRRIDSRSSLWLCMVQLGLVSGAALLLSRWIFNSPFDYIFPLQVLFLSVLWGTLTMIILPLTEGLFDVLSPLRLMELCQPDHPLQKRLQIEAPGTYHHSQMVAILAEASSDALRLNSRLVKSGAFFHDIGKLKRPQFFVENQFGSKNAHDDISPVMSALVIVSHVREGLDLALENKLPEGIRHFIAEHHGTTCLGYFYKKAKKMGLDPSESQFRYPGPRPKTKETGLVMLADSIEAAVRAERENIKSFMDLKEIVDGVTESKLRDGQLDDTGFTLLDLAKIKEVMLKTLKSMYHTRNIVPLQENKTPENGKDGQM
ncbi:HD family phosphohydrolase [Dethiosulfovibrio acidaminovorans]|nr:HDIG domain-containing metalloprotein [Dethiosulfovibrio acidaminovorans]